MLFSDVLPLRLLLEGAFDLEELHCQFVSQLQAYFYDLGTASLILGTCQLIRLLVHAGSSVCRFIHIRLFQWLGLDHGALLVEDVDVFAGHESGIGYLVEFLLARLNVQQTALFHHLREELVRRLRLRRRHQPDKIAASDFIVVTGRFQQR